MAPRSLNRNKGLFLLLLFSLCAALVAPARGDEAKYLPDNCGMFVSTNIPALLKSKLFQEGKNLFIFKEVPKYLQQGIGIPVENVARLLIAQETENKSRPLVIVSTIKATTVAEIRALKKTLPNQQYFEYKEFKIGNAVVIQEYFVQPDDPTQAKGKKARVFPTESFCVIEEKIVLHGNFEMIKRILERNKMPKLSAGIKAGIKEVGAHTVTMVMDLVNMPQRERDSMIGNLGEMIPGLTDVLGTIQTLTFHETTADKVSASIAITCKDAASASAFHKAAEAGLALLKGKPPMDDPMLHAEMREAIKAVPALIDAVKFSSNDFQVRAEALVEVRTALSILPAIFGKPAPKKTTLKDQKN
jgi:hypothetical protein